MDIKKLRSDGKIYLAKKLQKVTPSVKKIVKFYQHETIDEKIDELKRETPNWADSTFST